MKWLTKYKYVFFKILYPDNVTSWKVIFIRLKTVRNTKDFLKMSNDNDIQIIQEEADKPKVGRFFNIRDSAGAIYGIKLYETLDELIKEHFADLL